MEPGFSGEVVELYRAYRHGYPAEIVDAIIDRLDLGPDERAVDLGCGTAQLTIPLARRLRAVLAVDPEADMLSAARQEAERDELRNVGWLLGSDESLPLITALLGEHSGGLLTVAQALHLMDHRRLFTAARHLLRPGGGIAILSNGVPLWLQESAWSQSLRAFLETWFQTALTARCGTDEATQRAYAADLTDAGYSVTRTRHERTVTLDLDQVAGGVLSAVPEAQLPTGARREEFLRELSAALGPADHYEEQVPVVAVIGRR